MSPARRGVTEQAADAAIDQACRMLRLPTIRDRFAELADAAKRQQLTYRGFLAELLLAECDDRDRRRSARRVKEAGFPRPKSLEDFDFNANPNRSERITRPMLTGTDTCTSLQTSQSSPESPAP